MKIIEHELELGAAAPFSVIHLSDTHLTLADERNDKRKLELADGRSKIFPQAIETLKEAEKLQRETGFDIIHTGDLIDFVSEANLDAARDFVEKTKCFVAAGNHEFSLYVGEAKEDEAYRNQSLGRVQRAFGNDIRFSSFKKNGINFVAVDNSYYLFERRQLEMLREEVALGMPVVLCIHTPLFEKELYRAQMSGKAPDSPPYLMASPEDILLRCSRDRYEQQRADDVTREAYDYIVNEKGIAAILTGHLHFSFRFSVGGKPQIGVGCTDAGIINIK